MTKAGIASILCINDLIKLDKGLLVANQKKDLNTEQAAEYLGFAADTLKKWRKDARGPDYYKLSGTIRYKQVDLDSFIESSRVSHA